MVIARFVWFRRGLAAFMAEVNAANGRPCSIECHRGFLGLRWLVVARFE